MIPATLTPGYCAWGRKSETPLKLSSLNEYELANALRLAEFRKAIVPGGAAIFWSQFEADIAGGLLIVEVCNLAEVIGEGMRLSATHTISGGNRAFDILHVVAALRMGADEFLTFDERQKAFATKEGLRVPL
ncbi:MAG: type II toxin-antitoxin system VapC family toxin [Chthoniobacterales bacterium]